MLLPIFLIVIAYLFGSLSSAIIVCKLLKLPDPRTSGSKNPGTTNVLRLGGKSAAITVLIGDALKGLIPVLLARFLGVSPLFIGMIAIAAIIGHVFPVFFGFKGGKGIATSLGAIMGISLQLALATASIWILTAAIFRYSSLAAITATVSVPVLSLWLAPRYFIAICLIALIVMVRHYGNIKRLIKGQEDKIG